MRHIKYTRGDTSAIPFQLFSRATGLEQAITGYTFLLTVDSLQNPTDEVTKEFQVAGAISDAATGVFSFSPSALNSDLTGPYYYDVQATDSSGGIETIDKGRITFRQDITK